MKEGSSLCRDDKVNGTHDLHCDKDRQALPAKGKEPRRDELPERRHHGNRTLEEIGFYK